ncbi:MAG: hypothetical protein V4541_05140 [Bacteroidota bacterium]
MKSLVLSISSMLWFAVQANAQEVSTNVNISAGPMLTINTTSTKSSATTSINTNVITYNGQQDQGDDATRSKTFSKSFSLEKDDKVNLSNQFGSITVKTWDKNEIKVDADIKAFANTEAEAQKLIDNTTINAAKTGDLVAFKTDIGDGKDNWGNGSRNGKRWRREVKIYITVYMPASNALTATQKYGNIAMDNFSGPTSLKVAYGNLTANSLSNSNNYISVQYGKATLKEINQAKINQQYGDGLIIGSIGTLELATQYSAVNISTVKNSAVIKGQYGNGITIGSVGALTVNGQYTNVKVGKLHGNMVTKLQYGKLNIDEIEAGRNVEVDASYSAINLGFAANYNADFEVNTSYGGFKYGSNVTARKEGDDKGYSSSKRYNGQIGKGAGAKVRVNVTYDSVVFK